MDSRTENLKAELRRLYAETAERVVCRHLDSLVGQDLEGNVSEPSRPLSVTPDAISTGGAVDMSRPTAAPPPSSNNRSI